MVSQKCSEQDLHSSIKRKSKKVIYWIDIIARSFLHSDEEKSVVHFKLRVLGLVEAFVRKETSNPLVLVLWLSLFWPHPLPLLQEVVVPLYEVIQGSQSRKDHTPLVEKAKGIFKNRLCHMKGVCVGMRVWESYFIVFFLSQYPKAKLDVEHIHGHLHSLLDHLNKSTVILFPRVQSNYFLI